jgi:hypothetical protein
MQFAKISGLFALAAPLVVAQLSVYPPGGPGIVYVTLSGGSEPTGCLDANGKWTVDDANCAAVFGNGQGGLSGPNGWYILGGDDTITTTTVTWTTAWVGTHVSQGVSHPSAQNSSRDKTADKTRLPQRDAYDLIGNIGGSPTGGPVWYASGTPTGDNVVTLSGTSSAGAVQVSLTFNSTFEG